MKCLQRFIRREEGTAMAEFAVVLPVLALVFMAIIDLGMLMHAQLSLAGAVRAGAQTALNNQGDMTGVATVVASASGLNPLDLTVVDSAYCACAGGGAVACDGTCPDGGPYSYISVAGNLDFSPLFMALPGITDPMPLQAEAVFRAQ